MILPPADLEKLTLAKRSDAQARELKHMGIPFTTRRDGSLVVLSEVVSKMLGGAVGCLSTPHEPELVL